MKKLTLITIIFISGNICYGQNAGGSASQNVDLALADVVGTGFGGGSGGSGSSGGTVSFPISGTSALSEGLESADIQVTMQCNTAYDVNVSASASTFTYTGPSTFGTTMQVKDVLQFMVTDNQTGGNISSDYDQYQPIDGTNAKVAIGSGQPGVHTFSFKYKAQPGFNYPAGTYTTDIIFTVVKK